MIVPEEAQRSTVSSVDTVPLIIVSAADEGYGRCLYQFLLSLERRRLTGHRTVLVDLGLSERTRTALERRYPWAEFRRFPFERHPPHVRISARTYAWKPCLVAELMEEAEGHLLWLDSATILKSDLRQVQDEITRCGIYALRGQTALRERCRTDYLDRLAVPEGVRALPERVSGVVGIDARNPNAREAIETWRAYALDPTFGSPVTDGHNPDQALLSIILYRLTAAGRLQLVDADIDISSGSPVTWMSSRNKVPPGLPYWMDPLARLYYATYKVVDQWDHRRLKRAASRS